MRKGFGGPLENVKAHPHEEDHHERSSSRTDGSLTACEHAADHCGHDTGYGGRDGAMQQHASVVRLHVVCSGEIGVD
ncbi:hypothetical protein SCA03_30470 [Streptomyces cacaoi]|uniref:Uncharacterized protein n=1 Tax=Streptomyces cacaoi TaxID=1898 RepID=A0A4Y3QYH2_STRCI|nr:hypothetical protein SCA03_30470 [Streptomyces cacaoi]